jgi:hypothetical protein
MEAAKDLLRIAKARWSAAVQVGVTKEESGDEKASSSKKTPTAEDIFHKDMKILEQIQLRLRATGKKIPLEIVLDFATPLDAPGVKQSSGSEGKALMHDAKPANDEKSVEIARNHVGAFSEARFMEEVAWIEGALHYFILATHEIRDRIQEKLDQWRPLAEDTPHSGSGISFQVWRDARLLATSQSESAWVAVKLKIAVYKLAVHVNDSESSSAGFGNPANVGRTQTYEHYIRASFKTNQEYLTACASGSLEAARSCSRKAKLARNKYVYIVEEFGPGALLIWLEQLDAKPTIAGWTVTRLRGLTDAIEYLDEQTGGTLQKLTKHIPLGSRSSYTGTSLPKPAMNV